MVDTSNDVANQALQMIGGNTPAVTGFAPTFDNSTAGLALQDLYGPCVKSVAREFGFDFERNTVALALSGNQAPFPWTLEYTYPANGVEVWQLAPPALSDPNNPLPVNWAVANAIVGGQQVRVIHTNLAAALAVYNNAPIESAWDSLFREAVVRLLSSELAMALFGKPDVAQMYLESGAAFETIGEGRSG